MQREAIGIANVNIGTSGAEIGGAFGGEKKQVVAVNRVPTVGRPICVVKPIQSIQHQIKPLAQGIKLISSHALINGKAVPRGSAF